MPIWGTNRKTYGVRHGLDAFIGQPRHLPAQATMVEDALVRALAPWTSPRTAGQAMDGAGQKVDDADVAGVGADRTIHFQGLGGIYPSDERLAGLVMVLLAGLDTIERKPGQIHDACTE